MDEDVTDEAAGGAERRPAATAGVAVIVRSLPRELCTGRAIARPVADVEIGLDRPEDEFAAVLADEGDMGRFEEIKVLPPVHLGDPPSPGKGSGKGLGAFRHHEVCAISFGARTRL